MFYKLLEETGRQFLLRLFKDALETGVQTTISTVASILIHNLIAEKPDKNIIYFEEGYDEDDIMEDEPEEVEEPEEPVEEIIPPPPKRKKRLPPKGE